MQTRRERRGGVLDYKVRELQAQFPFFFREVLCKELVLI